jgi:hypothetical protein
MDEVNAALLEDLLAHFDESELRQFCHQLGDIGYDDLAGIKPRGKMAHLIAYMERRGRQPRLVRLLTTLQPQLTSKYRAILHESDRIQAQAAAIDDALNWLDELAAGEGAALDEAPTMTWLAKQQDVPRAKLESRLSWIDSLAQGSGAPVEEGPTMTWPEESPPATPEPYQVGGRITNPDYFFGRETERQWLRSRLLDMGSSVIVGLPYCGKSSLLYALAYHEPLPPEQRFLVAHLDLVNGRLANNSSLMLLNAVWQQWAVQVVQPRGQGSLPAAAPIKQLPDFTQWVKTFRGKGYRPVLCLDGFTQTPWMDGPVDEVLLALWRELGNEGEMAFVLTAERPLSALLPSDWLRSDFDTIFYQIEVGLLSERAARALLTEPAHRRGVTIPEPLVERWLDYCGAYPIFLQMAGSLLWGTLADNGRLRADVEAELQQKFRQWAGPHWQRVWRALSSEARHSFPRQPSTPSTPAERIIYRFLAGRGLLVVDGAQYRPFSSAFAQWLNQTYPFPARSSAPAPGRAATKEEKPNTGWLRRLWGEES